MSQWRRLSRKHRTVYLAVAVLTLAATALASSRLKPAGRKAAANPPATASLRGAMPRPSGIYIQKTAAFPGVGNVLVMARLTADQIAAKVTDGTLAFATLGNGQIRFRDDGLNGDAKAGDGVYTAVAEIAEADLARRADRDAATMRTLPATGTRIAQYSGRTLSGTRGQAAFDFAGFQAGRMVAWTQPVLTGHPAASTRTALVTAGITTDFEDHVLMIRDLGVVTDPDRTVDPCTQDPTISADKSWTFKHLMTQMAAPTSMSPSDFTLKWLDNWLWSPTLNSFSVPSRLNMRQLISAWRAASGGGDLNLDLAPFRLLAIVPRLDLRGDGGYQNAGSFDSAGEVRFVFGVVLPHGWRVGSWWGSGCMPLPFSVIFEYRIPKNTCQDVVNWASYWTDLDNYTPGTNDYNTRLEKLTEQVVSAGANVDAPNTSALGQLRTNEIVLADTGDPWQLREFHLDNLPWSALDETVVKETADDSFNSSSLFDDWVLNQIVPPLAGPSWDQEVPRVPDLYLSSPFQGARPEMPTAGFFWNTPSLNLTDPAQNWGRFRASFNSCNGCHAGETGTHFVHIDPMTPFGNPADLSGFLTGISVNDPANGTPTRDFNDLDRRTQDIQTLASTLCAEFASPSVVAASRSAKTGKVAKKPVPGKSLSLAIDDLMANHISEVH